MRAVPRCQRICSKKVKVAHPHSITERRVPELISVLCSQPAGDVSHKNPAVGCHYFRPGPQLPPATLKRAAASFAAW